MNVQNFYRYIFLFSIICFSLSIQAAEPSVAGVTASLQACVVQSKHKGVESEKKAIIAEKSIAEIACANQLPRKIIVKLLEIDGLYPRVIAQLIQGYYTASGEFIPYFDFYNASISTLGLDNGRFYICGVSEDNMLVVYSCRFYRSENDVVRHPLPASWDREQVESDLFKRVSKTLNCSTDYFLGIDFSCNDNRKLVIEEAACPLTITTMATFSNLSALQCTVVTRDTPAAQEGQLYSLLYMLPGVRFSDLAQAWEKSVTSLLSIRKMLSNKKFSEVDKVYGHDLDNILDNYDYHAGAFKGINDNTHVPVFFPKNMALETCLVRAREATLRVEPEDDVHDYIERLYGSE